MFFVGDLGQGKIMPRRYERRPGARKYLDFRPKDLDDALEEVKNQIERVLEEPRISRGRYFFKDMENF